MRLLIAALVLVPAAIAAQTQAGAEAQTTALAYGHRIPVPSAPAARRNGAIVLDARLDEPAWQAATPITQFTQMDPREAARSST